MQGTQLRHHLIDPRTGEPAQTEWLSVTVIAHSIIEADVYAKAILIGGQDIATKIMANNSSATFIAVDAAGNLYGSSNYKDYLYEPATNIFFSDRLAS
jgi:thiamine biosynthesis lipoprotein